jgi:hypothetical protein
MTFIISPGGLPGLVPCTPVHTRIPFQMICHLLHHRLKSWSTGRIIKMDIGSMKVASGGNPTVHTDDLAAKGAIGKT